MRFFSVFGASLWLLGSAAQASAEELAPRLLPVEIGLGSGYSSAGFGAGPLPGYERVWAIPLSLDVAQRVSKYWSLGAYAEVGFIDDSKSDVPSVDDTLRGHHYRVGFEALYHSAPQRKVQPWLGLGLGYDAVRATHRVRVTSAPVGDEAPDPGSSAPVRASGFEIGHAELGIDFAVLPAFAFGPFLGGSVVAYGDRRGIAGSDLNVWSKLGLKATLRL